MTIPLQVVWFKRDLRIHDHQPLLEASKQGPVLPLYVIEPRLWAEPDASKRQWDFCRECLQDLQQQLTALGQPLVIRVGEPVAVLDTLFKQGYIAKVWSHQETGNSFTYNRDRSVRRWLSQQGIPRAESPSNGVIRRLHHRNGWARSWEKRMDQERLPAPEFLTKNNDLSCAELPTADDLGLGADLCPDRQRGGRKAALELLHSFFDERGQDYARNLSSPLTAFHSCSRISAHLAYGTVSMREVVQFARARHSSRAFIERLHWHCHFIQKLESEPSLEMQNAHRAYDGLRKTKPERLKAWTDGRTGWPFIDACMRALRHTGWINFRMRAMLMSVASYHLWIDWRDSGEILARLFVDYEPGIHWNQCQMQSGTTGINTVRIYNPIKQGLDHDPKGIFIRFWVPELSNVPLVHLHTPWTMNAKDQELARCVLGQDYPLPLIDHEEAARHARDRIWGVRQGESYRREADAIQWKHGSRRHSGSRRGKQSRLKKQAPGQLSLDLGNPQTNSG